MKNNAKIKSKFLIVIVSIVLVSCKDHPTPYPIFLDVFGDKKLDVLTVEDNTEKHSMKDIKILVNGRSEKICSILPIIDSTYVQGEPKVEMIYLEANSVQTNEKGLRVIVRNTDLIPDYFFIDLFYEKEWRVERYGIINTNIQDSLYIISKMVNKSVDHEFGTERICDPKMIRQQYFNM